MSHPVITVIYGVPLTFAAADKIEEWKLSNDPRWFETPDGDTCGFTNRYYVHGPAVGYCGVPLEETSSYSLDLMGSYRFAPTSEQRKKAEELVAKLDPELRALVGPIGIHFVGHDS